MYQLTSVPALSELETGFLLLTGVDPDDYPSAQSVASRKKARTTFVPDVPGEYSFTVYEYREYVGAPSSFGGDPAAAARLVLVGQFSATLHCSAEVDLRVRTDKGHQGTIRLAVNDNTIRSATIDDTNGEVARVAGLDATVVTKLAALVGVTMTSVGEDLIARVQNLRVKLNAHLANAVAHNSADTTNVAVQGEPKTVDAAIKVLNELRTRLIGHLQATSTGGTWHDNDDLTSFPTASTATNIEDATVLEADLSERVYERHRVLAAAATPPIHNSADSTNVLTAESKLSEAIVAYLDAIVAQDPTAPSQESKGALRAAHRYGFRLRVS